MRTTKLTHACLILEDAGSRLLIDPGTFTELDPDELAGLAGVILTHEHPDHASPEHLRAIRATHGDVPIVGTAGAAAAAPDAGVEVVQPGDTRTFGPFDVVFGGGQHASIHSSIPQVDNLTVLVNGALYHPGDSLVPPAEDVSVLAAPVSGPWLKLGEVIDYVQAAGAEWVVPIHEVHASEAYAGLIEKLLGGAVENTGGRFSALQPGQSIDS